MREIQNNLIKRELRVSTIKQCWVWMSEETKKSRESSKNDSNRVDLPILYVHSSIIFANL